MPSNSESLQRRIVANPLPYDRRRGAEALQPLGDLPARAAALIEGAAGCSPFLAGLIQRHADWLNSLWEQAPETALASLIETLRRPLVDPMRELRILRQRAALLIALADLGGVWDLTQVTAGLSAFADAAIAAALDHTAAKAGQPVPGFFVLGLGKLGAYELNYSSDVDLVAFFDPDLFSGTAERSATECAVRLVQGIVRLLQEPTGDGAVLRVDLRLRPDPGATPVALSTAAAETYYAGRGQLWERAAFIKARPVAGDLRAGEHFLRQLQPFVFRKYLDFAAVEEIHDVKRRVNAFAGRAGGASVLELTASGPSALYGHDIKIGRGGIREIEFFAQAQQLIAGGREPKLQSSRTLAALAALETRGLILKAAQRDLTEAYLLLRKVEHRLQMIDDEQTQRLPKDPARFDNLARFLGFADTARFAALLGEHLRRVAGHYDALFRETEAQAREGAFMLDGPDLAEGAKERLSAMGFDDAAGAAHLIRSWLSGRPRMLNDLRSRERLQRLLVPLLSAFGKSDDPNGSLARFDMFLNALPVGAQIFGLLQSNPRLMALLAEVMGSAPRLARLMAQEARGLDAVTDPGFFEELPRPKALARDFAKLPRGDLEGVLDGARRMAREARLRVGLQLITGRIGAAEAGPYLSDLADAAIRHLLASVMNEFAERHGAVPGAEFAVLGLGRLGGRELTVRSDLDLVFVYDAADLHQRSEGAAHPLDATTYFIRFAQRLIAALTAPTMEGRLFEVDMRLRPAGNKGPVAVPLSGFERYYREEAWTYEQMALTRARVIAAPSGLQARLEAAVGDALEAARQRPNLFADIRDMRERIRRERPALHHWALKETDGGLMDIEFAAQALTLAGAPRGGPDTASMLDVAVRSGRLSQGDAAALKAALVLQLDLQQILRTALDGEIDPANVPPGLGRLLARTGQAPDFGAISAELADAQIRASAIVTRILV